MKTLNTPILYTSNTCPKCLMIKNHLGSNLAYFFEKNIRDAGVREELIRKGIMSIPTIIYGSEIILGFNPKRLDEIVADQKESAQK